MRTMHRGHSFARLPSNSACLAGDAKEGLPWGKPSFKLVGMTGFEPATSSSRTTRATKLRHIPIRCKSNFTRIADAGPGCEIGGRWDPPGLPRVAECPAAIRQRHGPKLGKPSGRTGPDP